MTSARISGDHQPYDGSPDMPFPPMAGAWSVVGWSDGLAREQARELTGYLPLWNYVDVLTPAGFYRFFCAEMPGGQQGICALKMQPRIRGTMLGAADDSGGGDAGGGDDGSTSTGTATTDTSQGATDGGSVQVDAPPGSGGGGGGGGQVVKPAAPSTSSGSSSNTGLVVGVIAALAVAGVVVAAAAAKHPVRH